MTNLSKAGRMGTRNSTAKPGPPESLARKVRTIRLIHVGWEARKAPVDAVVFFLDFPFYRTYQELRPYQFAIESLPLVKSGIVL